MPDGRGSMSKFVIDNSVPAYKNKDFMEGFSHMLLVSRRANQWNNEHELSMIQYAMKLSKVSCLEVYKAFWKAFSDPYVSADGVEWKHIFKHIKTSRKKKYSYAEMESYCTENGVSTDLFQPVVKEGKVSYWILKN